MVRIGRFADASGAVSYGIQQADGSFNVAEGCPFAGTLKDTGRKAAVKTLLAPVVPPEIICIGLNYRKHADELGLPYPKNPVVFLKPAASLAGPGAKVVKPRMTEKFDYEVELTIVIGKACKDVSTEEALDYVLGYTVANDLSTRDWQKVPEYAGGQWCRSKGFDGFAPIGPVMVTKDEIPNPNNLALKSYVNGQTRQDSSTNDLIFNCQEIISFLSQGCTLPAGTIIMTGTPAGVAEGMKPQAWLQVGDKSVVEVEKIGSFEIDIVSDPSSKACYANFLSKL